MHARYSLHQHSTLCIKRCTAVVTGPNGVLSNVPQSCMSPAPSRYGNEHPDGLTKQLETFSCPLVYPLLLQVIAAVWIRPTSLLQKCPFFGIGNCQPMLDLCSRHPSKIAPHCTALHCTPRTVLFPSTLQVYSYFEADMQPSLRVTLQDLQQALSPNTSTAPAGDSQQVLFLDTRNTQQYTGQVRRGPRAGHIPGAVSLPRAALLDEQQGGCQWKPLSEQQQLLAQAGVRLPAATSQQLTEAAGDDRQRVVLYCNGGVAACTAALALHRLGHRNWAVYDGSWNEYSKSELPVEVPE